MNEKRNRKTSVNTYLIEIFNEGVKLFEVHQSGMFINVQ